MIEDTNILFLCANSNSQFDDAFSYVLRMSFIILIAEEYDAYIIVSFVNATLVLSIGETVEEVTDSGFLGTTPTLSCSALGEDALVQVYCTWKLYHMVFRGPHA